MPAKPMTIAQIFESLSPAEKRKALAILSKAEQTPCEKQGHKFKKMGTQPTSFFAPPQDRIVCERCGKVLK